MSRTGMRKLRKIAAAVLAMGMMLLLGAQALGETLNGPLQQGDTGVAVTALQERLIELGYLAEEANGVYDDATREAVLLFQTENALLATGIADQVTLSVLMSDLAIPLTPQEAGWALEEEVEDGAYSYYNSVAMATGMPGMAAMRGYGVAEGLPFSRMNTA